MGLKNPPSSINLPGGVKVRAFDFRVTKLDDQGRPVAFERSDANEPQSDCVLWAADHFMNEELPADLKQRMLDREPKFITKGRSLGPTEIKMPPGSVPPYRTPMDDEER